MKEKLQEHFKRYQTFYICLGSCLVTAGITTLIMRGRHAGIPDGLDTNRVTVRPLSFLANQSNTIVMVIEREGRGHPGYLVRCLETNEVFTSQNKAAKAFDIPDRVVSEQIAGKLADAYGYHFERLGIS